MRSLLGQGYAFNPSRPAVLATIGLAGLFWLAAASGAVADPACGGVGVIIDSDSNLVLSANGHASCFALDGATVTLTGHVEAAIGLGDPSVSSFTYDSRDRLVSDTGSDATTTMYDADSRMVSATDPAGTTTYTYADPDLTSSTDPLGNTTRYAYDGMDRLVTETNETSGVVTTTMYDAQGEIVETVDSLGHVTMTMYDAQGDVIETIDALGHVTTMIYDAEGQVTSSTDPQGTTQYIYDAAGLLTESIDPLSRTTTYTYDALGNLIGESDPNGTTAFIYSNPVPEPGSLALLASGLMGVLGARRRQNAA